MPADGKPIPECRGFTIRRILDGTDSYLPGCDFPTAKNWTPPLCGSGRCSANMWWDYHVKPRQVVQDPSSRWWANPGATCSFDADATALTPAMTVTGQTSPQ